MTKTGTKSANSRYMNKNQKICVLELALLIQKFWLKIFVSYGSSDETLLGGGNFGWTHCRQAVT